MSSPTPSAPCTTTRGLSPTLSVLMPRDSDSGAATDLHYCVGCLTSLAIPIRPDGWTRRGTLPQLQRQMAYDRLLERLYLVDDGWVVKGATALLARDIGVRETIDIDIYRERARELAEAELREAAAR